MILYHVDQAIEIGYMKNLNIFSKTLVDIKENDLEMIGNDLSVSAKFLSNLASHEDQIADPAYTAIHKSKIVDPA